MVARDKNYAKKLQKFFFAYSKFGQFLSRLEYNIVCSKVCSRKSSFTKGFQRSRGVIRITSAYKSVNLSITDEGTSSENVSDFFHN